MYQESERAECEKSCGCDVRGLVELVGELGESLTTAERTLCGILEVLGNTEHESDLDRPIRQGLRGEVEDRRDQAVSLCRLAERVQRELCGG